jgi:hypothetical protein
MTTYLNHIIQIELYGLVRFKIMFQWWQLKITENKEPVLWKEWKRLHISSHNGDDTVV